MILPCLLPLLLLALPTAALTQTSDQTSTTAACTSRFGYYTLPLNTNAAVPTWYTYITSTSTTRLTTSTYSTVTSTYNATTTTQLDVLTSTATVLVTSTQTPEVFVVPTPAGFIPLTNHVVATPSPIPRIQRAAAGLSLPQSNSALAARQNRTPANYTGGFFVDRNGQTNSLDRKYLHRVNCVVSVGVSSTEVVLVSGVPETVYVAGPTEAVVEVVTRTSTVRVTSTVLEVEPRETVWEACGAGNVVDRIIDFNGRPLLFNRVVYRPGEGFPIENELVVNMTSAVGCCVACQTTANCAGSFYVPSDQECHLRLTQRPAVAVVPALPAPSTYPYPSGIAYPSGASYPTQQASSPRCLSTNSSQAPYPILNTTYPTLYPSASGIFPTASLDIIAMLASTASPEPIQNSNATCASGSMSLYLGTIQGEEDFPSEYALAFSNGPCGRLSVWPLPVQEVGGVDM